MAFDERHNPDGIAYARREEAFEALCGSDEVKELTALAYSLFAGVGAMIGAVRECSALSTHRRDDLVKVLTNIASDLDGDGIFEIRCQIGSILDIADANVESVLPDFPRVEQFLAAVSCPGAAAPRFTAPATMPGGQLHPCMTPSHDRPAVSFEREIQTVLGIVNARAAQQVRGRG